MTSVRLNSLAVGKLDYDVPGSMKKEIVIYKSIANVLPSCSVAKVRIIAF